MPGARLSDPPSPFIEEWIEKLSGPINPPRRALDVAMGRGRHALLLAGAGFRTYGVDSNYDAVAEARARGKERGLDVRGWCADLTMSPLPAERFELIVVNRYLQRTLCGALIDALVPGGFLLYETFTERQKGRGRGPQSPEHLLKTGELRELFARLDEVFYDEPIEPAADWLARLAARKRSSPS